MISYSFIKIWFGVSYKFRCLMKREETAQLLFGVVARYALFLYFDTVYRGLLFELKLN